MSIPASTRRITGMTSEETAAPVLTALVRAELANEMLRKTSLEQRGVAVITSSGTLITLIFAIGTVAGARPFVATGHTRAALLTALLCLIGAAIAGILVNWPWQADSVSVDKPDGLRDLIEPNIFHGEEKAVDRRIVKVQVDQIDRMRRVNGWKAKALLAGLALEVLASLAVAAVIAIRIL